MKKIIAVILVVVLMLSMCTIIAYAEVETEQTVEYAIDCLDALETEIDVVSGCLIVVSIIAAGSLCWNIILNYKLSVLKYQLEEHIDKKNKKKKKK